MPVPLAELAAPPPADLLPEDEAVVVSEEAVPSPSNDAPAQGVPVEELASPPPETAPAEVPVEEAAPGPFTSAVQTVQSGLGEAVAPLVEQLPEPVQNLADIVGQPVGGALDAATAVTAELGQGDLPGAAGAVLEAAGGPQRRAVEQAGTRVAEGLPVAPHNEFLDDPGSALAILPSLSLGTGIAAGGGASIDEWAQANPGLVEDAYATGGGRGVIDAYLASLDASPIPPPQLVNPFDAGAIDANPIERALAIGGDIDDFLGGWATATREGAVLPFLKNMAIETAMDPLTLVPPAVGARISGAGGRLVRRIPGVSKALELSPTAKATIRAEDAMTAVGELLPARRAMDDAGLAPAAPLTPGVRTPAPNGRLAPTPDLGQAAAAAPPIPEPGIGFPRFEHVRLDPNAPLRPRSDLTGRPIIPPGSRPDIEGPIRAHLDSLGLPEVGITIVNDMRDAAPDARPTDQIRFIPETNSLALSLDTTRAAEWPALIERAAQQAIREQTQRQATQTAYGAASPAAQQMVAETPQPRLTKSGTAVSEPALRDLELSGNEIFKFADSSRPAKGLDVEDVLDQTLRDVEYWANADDVTSARFLALDKKLNPDGRITRESLRGPVGDMATREAREQHVFAVLEDAAQRAIPRNAPKTRLGKFNQHFLGTVRRSMLFNPFNIARYTLQNLLGNSVNLTFRAGLGAVVDLFTKPANLARTFRNARTVAEGKPVYHTHAGSMIAAMKVGTKPNIAMNQVSHFNQLGGKTPTWLERGQRVLAPNTLKYIGTMADQLPREVVAERAIQREYRRMNREMPAKILDDLRTMSRHDTRLAAIPQAKIEQVWRDFSTAHRTLTDLNTGAPYRTMLGREAKYEPVWAADDLGKHLKEHLTEEMRDPPDTAALNRAVDRITRDSKNYHRKILDTASDEVDHALFSWRNTNADEMAGKMFLFHYWMSRQGGLYVTEALKRPYLMSAYGRMMEEFEQQAEELNQPPYMKGFFQFQNSIAGYSTWFNPFDLVQSLLTFADWQMGMEDAEYKDLTSLGNAAGMAPFLIHPMLAMVAYDLGLLGPDYYTPMLTGTETYGANAINLLNLANAKGLLPDWVPGTKDANGNPIPLNPRPLQELYARVGNAISSMMAPVTGLSPVEVANFMASRERNIASFVETDYRRAHPEALQTEVNEAVTQILADHGSPEYQAALRKDADMPYALMEGVPGPLAAAARIASPFRIFNWPEQYNVDRWNLTPSGDVPERNIPHFDEIDPATGELTPAGERAKYVYNAAKYGTTATPEARHINDLQQQYDALEPLDYAEANDLANDIYYGGLTGPVTVGGQEYTPDEIAAMDGDTRYRLGTQALADAGYTRDDQVEIRQSQANFLGENPELAGFKAYQELIRSMPGETQADKEMAFINQTALENPGFAQFVRSSLMDHVTGVIDPNITYRPDAYLATQGVRPSVYSPLVGNEPSRVPGGYPSLAGLEPGTPLLGQVESQAEAIPYYTKPVDPNESWAADDIGGWVDPRVLGQMQVVTQPSEKTKGLMQVQLGDHVAWVNPADVESANPPQPTAAPGPAPAAIQPAGGLAGLAGSVTSALGAGKDELGAVIGTMTGSPSTPPSKPSETSAGIAPGAYDVVSASDGIGEQSTEAGSDRSWMEFMLGNDAQVNINYKQPVTWGVDYSYQNGHGADGTTHAAFDISCASGNCLGHAMVSPVSGKVVCAGYGEGTGEAIGSPQCTYSQNTTLPGQAHTIVVEVGQDANGSPIQLSFNHMGETHVTPGQMLTVGDPLGTMGNTDAGPHVHLEGWLGDPASGYLIVDPQLIVGGYYGPVESYATLGGEVITPA